MTKERNSEGDLGPGEVLGGLIAGYLDVKLPARSRRRRFGVWKSWRRHWVEARLTSDDSICGVLELALSASRLGPESAVVRVPARASVCRTASRSRSHAFVVAHPGAAVAAGSVTELGGDNVFLAARCEADTERWMAVLRAAVSSTAATSAAASIPSSGMSAALLRGRRLSRSEGDLLALLPQTEETIGGPGLHEIRRGHAVARTTSAVTASTLSRSPARAGGQIQQSRQPFRLLYGRRRAETLRSDMLCADKLADKLSSPANSGSALSLLGGKIASGLISAGLGLMLTTPGGSEVEDNDGDPDGDEEVDIPAMLPTRPSDQRQNQHDILEDTMASMVLDRRRESAVSVASGIYEEIIDSVDSPTPPVTPPVVIDRVYENASVGKRRPSNGLESHYEDPTLLFSPKDGIVQWVSSAAQWATPTALPPMPPPLPPRQNLTPISELLTRTNGSVDTTFSHCAAVDANGYVQMGLVRCMHAKTDKSKCHQEATSSSDVEPTYLPMSPIRPFMFESQDKNV